MYSIVWRVLHSLVAQARASDEQHKAAERVYWERQLRVGKWLNRITAGAAVVAIVGLLFVWLGLEETKRATIEANRAWLSPVHFKFERPLEDKDGPLIQVLFQNIGRDPAMNLKTAAHWEPVNLIKPMPKPEAFPEIVGGWEAMSATIKKDCWNNEPEIGNVAIIPTNNLASSFTASNPSPIPNLDPIVKDHTQILVVKGCMTYTSFEQTRHTSFCHYLRGEATLEFASCRGGNFSD
jgi:hypothetical protein